VAATSLRLSTTPAKELLLGSLLEPGGALGRRLRGQLVLHLDLHNEASQPQTLREVSVATLRRGVVQRRRSWRCPALARRLRGLPWIAIRDRRTLAAAHRYRARFLRAQGHCRVAAQDGVSLLSIALHVDLTPPPDTLRLRARSREGGVAELRIAVRAPRQQTQLRLPFRGRWVALAGHRAGEPHASLHLASQRFAHDLVIVGADGRSYAGDRRKNRSYRAYGQPVVAAADGVVVRVGDGVADNTPVGRRPSWRALLSRPRELAGNYVVLRHRGGEHSAYFHLQRGLPVKLEQRVKAGQLLGRCGNSGNSAEPHLHFQLQDGPDPLRARGLPPSFSDFSWHYGHVTAYVTASRRAPLPARLVLEPGRAVDAIDATPLLRPRRQRPLPRDRAKPRQAPAGLTPGR
jgi:murein DD-endopeptidase MepM/ murein hydrolase activator NlpD